MYHKTKIVMEAVFDHRWIKLYKSEISNQEKKEESCLKVKEYSLRFKNEQAQ